MNVFISDLLFAICESKFDEEVKHQQFITGEYLKPAAECFKRIVEGNDDCCMKSLVNES
jgi:hypothetical protein